MLILHSELHSRITLGTYIWSRWLRAWFKSKCMSAPTLSASAFLHWSECCVSRWLLPRTINSLLFTGSLCRWLPRTCRTIFTYFRSVQMCDMFIFAWGLGVGLSSPRASLSIEQSSLSIQLGQLTEIAAWNFSALKSPLERLSRFGPFLRIDCMVVDLSS